MVSIFRPRRRLACLALALIFSGQALAIGLSSASGQAVLGQPLRIRIPLIGTSDGPLDAACFRLLAPQSPTDADYVLRDGRVRVESVQGQTQLIVTSQASWRHPVVEFRIVASCGGAEVARDYMLLASLPPPPQTQPQPEPKEAPVPVAAAARAPAAASGETLRLATDSNLNALARSRYADQREIRDEYRRLMAAANPALFAGKGAVGSVPLPAGTVLNIPPNLPQPGTVAAPPPVARTGDAASTAAKKKPPSATPDAAAATAGKTPDRLVIGGNAAAGVKPLSPRELAAAVDRLERMVEDQGRIHLGMSESMKNVEIAFGDIHTKVLAVEARMKALEIERVKAETERARAMAALAEERARFGFLEMLALVLASGAIGAGLIHYYHRLQGRRPVGEPLVEANLPPAAKPDVFSGFETLVTAALAEPSAEPAESAPRPVSTPLPETSRPLQAPVPVMARPASPLAAAAPAMPEIEMPAVEPAVVAIDPISLGNQLSPPQTEEVPPMIEFSFEELPPHAVPPEPTFSKAQTTVMKPPEMFDLAVPGPGHDPAIELAEVMESMGLAHGAAHTLVEHIRSNPAESMQHWLKLLDLRHRAGLHEQLADSVKELKSMFNVALDEDGATPGSSSLVDYQHLARELTLVWGKPECGAFLRNLIADTRAGTRAGFPRAVVEEILLLRAMLDIAT